MNQLENSAYRWWAQRISVIFLLFPLPWFVYLFFSAFYTDENLFFDEKLLRAINHPLELLFFLIFLSCIFWHASLGMQVICEDYIRSSFFRIFVIMFVRYLSIVTYVVFTFTIFFFYKHIFL
ncbi:MAG: succinate dehydrogenase, hydrophobic membrane anchor protein [Wolbachia endosymbiont of Meromenopon meropis]|nr:succinate dehydrogenase, hydrophobic membrane anchor protein [Wolbachia endosymbiont of Meromenopon meropis]